ncbi:MAG TPA: hypothetical protein VHP13_12365 [Gammaproteobacteria bacterium]|jgi:hypothetical protein|nr:hypothetical protein [Gammaproteobacteria bacterium]
MKKFALLMPLLALAACTLAPERQFEDDPQGLGLYVAATNIYVNTAVGVKNAQTGELMQVKVVHLSGRDEGYMVASLPPGRYYLEAYSPDNARVIPLESPNAYFEVQNNCFNYGGMYTFTEGQDGGSHVANANRLEDIANLPKKLRKEARERDICSATMGHDNERLSAADVAGVIRF